MSLSGSNCSKESILTWETKNVSDHADLQVLLDEDDAQTQQQLVDQLNVTREVISPQLKAMGEISLQKVFSVWKFRFHIHTPRASLTRAKADEIVGRNLLDNLCVTSCWLRVVSRRSQSTGRVKPGSLQSHPLHLSLLSLGELCCYDNEAQVDHKEWSNLKQNKVFLSPTK